MATPGSASHLQYSELENQDFKIRGHAVFVLVIFFSVALLFSLLFFYARWLCSYYRHLFLLDPASHGAHAPFPGQHNGIHPARIKALPVTLYKSSAVSPALEGNSPNNDCCICLGGFQEGEKVKALPKCKHCFHGDCVDQWLVAQPSCPICRTSLFDDPVVVVVVPTVAQ